MVYEKMNIKIKYWFSLIILCLISTNTNAQNTFYDPVFGKNVILMKSTPIQSLGVVFNQENWKEKKHLQGTIFNELGGAIDPGTLNLKIKTKENTFLWEENIDITESTLEIPFDYTLPNLQHFESEAWLEANIYNQTKKLTSRGKYPIELNKKTNIFFDISADSKIEIDNNNLTLFLDLIGKQNFENANIKIDIFKDKIYAENLISTEKKTIDINKNLFLHEVIFDLPSEKGSLIIQAQLFDTNNNAISTKKEWTVFSEGKFIDLNYLLLDAENIEEYQYKLRIQGVSNLKNIKAEIIFEDELHSSIPLEFGRKNNPWSIEQIITFPTGIYHGSIAITGDNNFNETYKVNIERFYSKQSQQDNTLREKAHWQESVNWITIIAIVFTISTISFLFHILRIRKKRNQIMLWLIAALTGVTFSDTTQAQSLENTWIFPPATVETWSFTDQQNNAFRHLPINGVVIDSSDNSNPFYGGHVIDLATRFVHIDTGETRTFRVRRNIQSDWTIALIGYGYGEYFFVLDLDKVASQNSEEGISGILPEGNWDLQIFFEIQNHNHHHHHGHLGHHRHHGPPVWYATDTIDGNPEFSIDRSGPTLALELKDHENNTLSGNDFTNQPITVDINCNDNTECINDQSIFSATVKGNFCDDGNICNNQSNAARTYEVCDKINNCNQISTEIVQYDVRPPNINEYILGLSSFFNNTLRAEDSYEHKISFADIESVRVGTPQLNGTEETLDNTTYQNLFHPNACGESSSSDFIYDSGSQICESRHQACIVRFSFYTARGLRNGNYCVPNCPAGYQFHWFWRQCYKP